VKSILNTETLFNLIQDQVKSLRMKNDWGTFQELAEVVGVSKTQLIKIFHGKHREQKYLRVENVRKIQEAYNKHCVNSGKLFPRPVAFDENKEAERHLSGDEENQYKLDFSPSKEHPVFTDKVKSEVDVLYDHKQKLIGIIGDLNCQIDIIKQHGGFTAFQFPNSNKQGHFILTGVCYRLKV
jgi:transcriptional regulator with XRE-family HTH domain